MFLGETLHPHNASVSTQAYNLPTGKFNAGDNPAMDQHPNPGMAEILVEILIVASYYRNWHKRWPGGPLGTYTDFTSTSELAFASFSDRMLVQNVSHDNDLLFMRMNNAGHIYFHTNSSHEDSLCHRGKCKLGIGLFIHELAQGVGSVIYKPLLSFLGGLSVVAGAHLLPSIFPFERELRTTLVL